MEQQDPGELIHILRVLGVIAGHLELENAAGGDLHPGKAEAHPLHILGQILTGEVAGDGQVGVGKHKQVGGDFHGSQISLIRHNHNSS